MILVLGPGDGDLVLHFFLNLAMLDVSFNLSLLDDRTVYMVTVTNFFGVLRNVILLW